MKFFSRKNHKKWLKGILQNILEIKCLSQERIFILSGRLNKNTFKGFFKDSRWNEFGVNYR